MDRVAVFAHYDADNIIKDYVIYYLKELNKIVQKIIFVSDCELPQHELDKIENIVCHSIAHKHGEYDFGSYKRGYLYAKDNNLLNECDEFVLANDSCYGPLYPFQNLWEKCDGNTDFWGVNSNSKYTPYHIQSFFVVFKPNVFRSEVFDNFMNNIKKEKSKDDIIEKYEIGLTQLLIKNGFTCSSLFDESIVVNNINMDFVFPESINPFIKVSALKNHSKIFAEFMCKYIFNKFNTNYSTDMIFENFKEKNFLSRIKADIKSIRKCLIRVRLKEGRISVLGKRLK